MSEVFFVASAYSCPCNEFCYLQKAMSSIGGKWKLPILCSLNANGSSRYNDILRNVHGISNTMLSKTLREMEADGLVQRHDYLEVPVRVEYSLTEKAACLQPILVQLIRWEAEWQPGEHGREHGI